MSQFSVIQEIYRLAKDRNWQPISNFVYGRGDNIIHIERTNLEKYKTEYKKSGGWTKSKKIGCSNLTVLPKIDKWLVDCIRKEIPEANYYTFELHTIMDIVGTIDTQATLTYKAINI